ncbi:hypothetical protein CEXT_288011 [Caerostris extrusa]|uniref:Uncharacterized protein n=1 Tax=Caerostris extrusa TaxID=172846 RepID=A0AAV4YB67_CAEEX|nr:hypothetical protein CEXT_288011 [Caerostris extrusa]
MASPGDLVEKNKFKLHGLIVLREIFQSDVIPLGTVIYDMIPVLQYVTTGTLSAFCQRIFPDKPRYSLALSSVDW